MAPALRLLAVPFTTLLALSACGTGSAGDERAGHAGMTSSSGAGGSAAGAPAGGGTAGTGGDVSETAGRANTGGTGVDSAGMSGAGAGTSGDATAGGAAGASDGSSGSTGATPELTAAEWKLLRALAPDMLPAPPPDVSNRVADDATAAAFGETIFRDTKFSGKLLDLDNDGSPRTLGVRGQSGKVACAGCHDPKNDFLDNRSPFKQITLGTGWTGRRTPSLLDVGQAKVVMWGGRHTTLHSQVFGALENPLEMNSSRLFLAEWIAQNYAAEYEALFGAGTLAPLADTGRFPALTPDTTGCSLTQNVDHPRAHPPDPLYDCHGFPGDGAEYDALSASDQELVTRIVVNAGKAIGAYERLLTCGAGRFDAWVHGDAQALSVSEQNGAKLFVGKAGCVSCHSGPYFSDQQFYALGLEEMPTRAHILNGDDHGAALDLPKAAADPLGINGIFSDGNDGRLPADVAITAAHEGAFRTPALRCSSRRPSFMHSALLASLGDVVAFFNRGGDAPGGYVGTSVLKPLELSNAEQADLVAFLQSLDGDAPVPTFQ